MSERVVRRKAAGAAALGRVDEGLLQEAVRRLAAALQPEQIYLFGSRARGDAQEESDYDFLVIVPDEVDGERRELEQRAHETIYELGISADILVQSACSFRRYRPVAASLVATVEREGRLLYGEPDQAEEVVSQVELEERRDELVRDWLERAEQDLMAADRAVQPPMLVNAVAFHAQQAAEKALKAFLTWHNQPLRKTHLLESLLEECVRLSPDFASLDSAARTLTPYAIAGRYPNNRVAPTERDAEQARRLAHEVVRFVRDHLPNAAR